MTRTMITIAFSACLAAFMSLGNLALAADTSPKVNYLGEAPRSGGPRCYRYEIISNGATATPSRVVLTAQERGPKSVKPVRVGWLVGGVGSQAWHRLDLTTGKHVVEPASPTGPPASTEHQGRPPVIEYLRQVAGGLFPVRPVWRETDGWVPTVVAAWRDKLAAKESHRWMPE